MNVKSLFSFVIRHLPFNTVTDGINTFTWYHTKNVQKIHFKQEQKVKAKWI